jgi:hypothetical protein
MWTSKNRARYDRSKLRYPSDLTDDEWGLVEPLIPPGTPRLNPPHAQKTMQSSLKSPNGL